MDNKTITQAQLDVLISYLGSVDTDTLSFEGKEIFVNSFNYVMKTYDIPKIEQLHALIGPKVVKCVQYMTDHGHKCWPDNEYKNTHELFGAVCGLFEEVLET